MLVYLLAPPHIVAKKEKIITLDKGEKLQISVTVTGEPKPEIKWYCNDQEIKDEARKDIQSDAGSISLSVKNVQRDDSGNYKVTASNEFGFDSAAFKVQITGNHCECRK